MIIIKYNEKKADVRSGEEFSIALGVECHSSIEEVILPMAGKPFSPVFFTKKFAGHLEHRWQVLAVLCEPEAIPLTYCVTLLKRSQIGSEYFLRGIVAARNGQKIRSFLHPWSLVEVEFGHPGNIGKTSGQLVHNERYFDAVQLHSMPKRRLAIVNQVLLRSEEDLLQVIPISSRKPHDSEKASVEVTSELTKMVHYQKPSWALCRQVQTVTASRVIAPMVQRSPRNQQRDRGFRQQIRGEVREALKDALMYGVAAGHRVAESHALLSAESEIAQLSSQITFLTKQVIELREKTCFYEQLAKDVGLTQQEVRELYETVHTSSLSIDSPCSRTQK